MAHAVHDLNACQLLLVHRRLHPHHFQQFHHCLLLARCHYHHWHLSFVVFYFFLFLGIQFTGYHRNYRQSNVCHLLLDMPYK